ncbi:inactive tyrosine-protein kinase PEAK1 isoform X3 [Thunnus albacares]|uniref:inactive tyrosine-protein kinase PEAK1 isoform X3 n=1 Tax=Thunnus albacares TaxID=8236 RepID=UPI001CF6A806|nr:inactive tyrosine-protein kinase PEAK1 isoform X3 [Thunnus albacares]
MASGSASRAEEQPPALPAKKHRSQSRCSSEGSDSVMVSPVGLQHQNSTYNDVFPETTDCHAAQCPIHQRYDHSLHQQRNPQYFDNPLYMLAPLPDTYLHEETEEFKPVGRSPLPLASLSQLCFDTPDEHLPYLFSSFDDHRAVSQGIQYRHLLFLRSMAQSVEARILLQADATGRDVSSYQPQDFLLCEGSEPKQIGDMVYYSLHSPKLPGRVLALSVNKQQTKTDETLSARIKHQPSHVNVQNVIAYFQPSSTLKNNSDSLQTQDPARPSKSECTAAKPPGGGSPECPLNINLPTIQSVLQQGHCVSVERDLPHVTLEDFVQESSSLQSTECAVYDRQVCVLLLQILLGSQHLYHLCAAAELRPREIFLVWPNKEGENEAGFNTSKTERSDRLKEEMELEKMEKKGRIQMLWKTQGSPRVVLTPVSSAPFVLHPFTSIKSKIGALIQYCWGPQESFTSPPQSKSPYRRGLSYLASLLQNESSGPQMADMVTMLQVLLWGPRLPLFNHKGSTTTAVHNWLTIKRALLVMKLAERGLIQDQSALDWEDCVCLQYLSFTDPETVVSVNSQLSLTLNVD